MLPRFQKIDSDLRHYAVAIVSMGFVLGLVFAAGFWTTILSVALIMALALLIRVILTGEWSETTWFGKFVHLIAKSLGAKDEDTKVDDKP